MQRCLPRRWSNFTWLALLLAAALPGAWTRSASAADAYYRVPFSDLKLTDGEWPKPQSVPIDWTRSMRMAPRAFVDGGDAYLEAPQFGWSPSDWVTTQPRKDLFLVVRAEAGKDVVGTLMVPTGDLKAMTTLRFAITPAGAGEAGRAAFYRAQVAHYEGLLAMGQPGAAWFRHQAQQARTALGGAADPARDPQFFNRGSGDTLDDTYNLFAGGRAVSENLQLDRVLPAGRRTLEPSVPFDKIPGVTTKEMDWAPLIKGKQPATDALATFVPIDQHAIFFPSFAALRAVVDEADTQGVPVIQAMEPQAVDARVKERYQRQLCLGLTGMSRLLGPRLIKTVAITGSDAYLRVGSDVALLFEAKDVTSLRAALAAQLSIARQREPSAESVEGKVGAVDYIGLRSPDRAVCSYVARLGDSDVMVVTNSLAQLERLAAVRVGSAKSVASAPEYTFFRDRYPKADADESAFLVLTDATIRRWCGPRSRILDSRRTVAAAVMAELQAANVTPLATGKVEPSPLATTRVVPGMGNLRLTAGGVTSSNYGTLEFMTPIAELSADKATEEEAQLYGRWREGYEQNWSTFFDPIALLRLSVRDGRMAADLSVIPLIARTEYRELLEISRGVTLAPDAADRHNALLHVASAINRESPLMKQVGDFLKGQSRRNMPGDPLGWVGKSAAIYVDDDPLWAEAAAAADPEKFMQENYHRLPIALYVANEGPLRLAAFMAAVRAYVDDTSPDSAVWEPQRHNGQSYVRVSGKGNPETEKVKVYYATMPEALVVSLNEGVIQRSLDRHAARRAAKAGEDKDGEAKNGEGKAAPATAPAALPWLGESAALEADGRAIAMIRGVFGRTYQRQMQDLSWQNLPIFNEWRRLFPDQDPVAVHERLWQVRLVDPGGGQYAWNEKARTVESTRYGHPAEPKNGPGFPAQLDGVTRIGLGITFEHQGLRAKGVIERKQQP